MTEEKFAKYLERIDYNRKPCVDIYSLINLQRNHLLNIPFENLDIHRGVRIILNEKSFYEKIVENNRGGFCYELNGLFKDLLSHIGFDAFIVSGRVFNSSDNFSDEFDHLAIIVEMKHEKWLCDVGFGEFTFTPLRMVCGIEQKDERGIFRIERYDDTYYLVQKKINSSWKSEYIFSLIPRRLDEFKERCNYNQTSPVSNFTQKKLCSIPIIGGRITLTDRCLKITKGDKIEEIDFNDDSQFYKLLSEYFNIDLVLKLD